MQLMVSVRPEDGRFVARLGDSDRYKMDGDTAAVAVAALQHELERLACGGELVFVDLPVVVAPASPRAERSEAHKELLRQIAAEAYRARDEEKAREFPE